MRAPLDQSTAYTVFPARGERPSDGPVQPTRHDGAPLISLDVVDTPLETVVRDIAHQAHVQLAYDKLRVSLSQRVTVHLKDVSVPDALERVLRGTGVVARLTTGGETIALSPKGVGRETQTAGGVITGRVTDSASGAGLKGAQVQVEGVSKLSALTSDSGNFTLREVPVGDQVLRVRLFGYRPATRTVTSVDGERTTVRIALAAVPTVLSGVVTTATGIQRKVAVGNDITTINVDSVMHVAPVSTVTDLLETRVPGLTVQHTSGVPGNPSRIRIRGVSSITGNNDPIVIVDGIRVYASQSDPRNDNLAQSRYGATSVKGSAVTVPAAYAAPSPIDQIDPNSIETIEVFKGPSASALYGSDAANGVIVITTKHGRAGPTHWSLNLGQGVNWLPGSWPTHYFKFGSKVVADTTGQAYCQWYDPRCRLDSLVAFQALNDPRFSPFTHGSDQTAALTVSGGVPTLQYSLTGSGGGTVGNFKLPAYAQQQYEQQYGPAPSWMLRPDHHTTYGVDGQVTAQPTGQTRVTLQSSLFKSNQQQGSSQQATTQLEGEYIGVVNGTLVRPNTLDPLHPPFLPLGALIQNEVERATASALTATNNLTLGWQPWSWLPLNATGGLQTIQRTDQTYVPYGILGEGPGFRCGSAQFSTVAVCDTTGSYGLGRGTSEDRTLTLGTSVPSRWLTTAVGLNYHSSATNDFRAYTTQLAPGVSVPPVFVYHDTTTGPTYGTSGASTYGWYVEPRLNFNSRFFMAPGFRLDGGSAVGANGGFHGTGLTGFPKLDFSWIAVDRDQPRGPLSQLRPRLSFGYAGTQPDPTAKLRILNEGGGQTVALDGTTRLPGVVISTLGNTRLRPETSRELEGGFDTELWRGRLTLTWTQYNKTRYNAIIPIPVAPSVFGTGTFQQYVNIGVVRSTGTELTWNTAVLESRALGWNVGGNLSNNNNRVVRLAAGFQPNKLLGIVPGYPLFSRWARPIVSYADVDHNGIITGTEYTVADSAVYVGQAEPKYQANLNTTLTLFHGRLSATATFAYQNGQMQSNLTALQSAGVALIPNAPGTSLGTQAAFLAALCSTGGNAWFDNTQTDPFFGCHQTSIGVLQTVNTFRFNELSVNYTLPTGMTQWLHVPRASLALQGQNLGLHTNYRGFDPNVNAFSTVSGGDQTADLGQLPPPRIWWLKLNLGN